MKRLIILTAMCAAVMISPVFGQAEPPPARENAPAAQASAAGWVVMDTTSNVVLAGSNATKKLQVGSITKIATALVVLDWAAAKGEQLTQMATVPQNIGALNSPNSIGLAPGDQISLRDALYASLMQSDNQAAETLAIHVGHRLGNAATDADAATLFVAQMNALARTLGLRDTRFLNSHGLDDLEDKLPYSTAKDVAILSDYAISKEGFLFYTSQKERKISWQNAAGENVAYMLRNTNEALGEMGIDGMKTGTTRKAGPCVVITAAQRPESKKVGEEVHITPRRITVVVLGSPNRFDTAKALLRRGWSIYDQWAAAGRPKNWKAAR